VLRPATTLLQRRGPLVQVRGDNGGFDGLIADLAGFESALAVAGDPVRTPEVLAVRDQVRSWRFYDTFRTDSSAPARAVQIGTRTLALADDGSDLAAALQTIAEIGVAADLDACVDDAFPGSRLRVSSEGGRFDLSLHQPGLLRPLRTAELSDGTLRYLLWAAALLSPRPGELIVCNEPETSLHRDLLPALAGSSLGRPSGLRSSSSPTTPIWPTCWRTKPTPPPSVSISRRVKPGSSDRRPSTGRPGPGAHADPAIPNQPSQCPAP
jgi:predicted ATPase